MALTLGGYAVVGGAVSFLGWPLDVPRLTDWFGDGVSIQPNAALLIALAGIGVVLVQLEAWKAAAVLGALIAAAGALTLVQYVVGVDLGFNHILLFGRGWGQGTTLTPGRVGPPASGSFVLIGLALLMLGYAGLRPLRARLRHAVPTIGLAVCALMSFSLLGYLFDAEQFYSIPSLTAIALQTATMLFSIAGALVISVPEHDPALLMREDSGAGALARVTTPALALMIPLVHWLRVQGHEAGYYDVGTGRALGGLALISGALAIVWMALRALRRHEHVLREADRRKDLFLATLAHELRNPLAPMRNAIELQRLAIDDRNVVEAARAILERQIAQMGRLVDELLDMSRITGGRLELRKSPVALADVSNAALETSRPVIEASGHELTTSYSKEPIYVHADGTRLAQVFSNLLNNAAKYTISAGHIWLTAEVRGDEAVIIVRDTGIGIAKEDLTRIFDLFTQVAPASEVSKGGLGIGLSLARGLVELHGGSLEAESGGYGNGSAFAVRLPVIAASRDMNDTRADMRVSRATRRRIVVVDDLKDTADSFSTMLRLMGHDTQTAYDGIEAVRAVSAFEPDIVFLDIGLPRMNGYDAARSIRAQPGGNTMTLVALTGWGQEQDRHRASEAGFDHHLTKPVDRETIEALIDSLRAAKAV